MPAANGTRSFARISSSERSSTATSKCVSSTIDPWPGKCLSVAAMPASCMPATYSRANAATTCGSGENARLPIARLPRSRSITGAKLRSTPVARISLAISHACSRASASAASASRRYSESKPLSGGSALKPSRKRCTRPPSWSTAISCGRGAASRMAWVSSATCAFDAKLRANSTTPAQASCCSQSRSRAVSSCPETPICSIYRPCVRSSAARSSSRHCEYGREARARL